MVKRVRYRRMRGRSRWVSCRLRLLKKTKMVTRVRYRRMRGRRELVRWKLVGMKCN
jgi:hypothetical protein